MSGRSLGRPQTFPDEGVQEDPEPVSYPPRPDRRTLLGMDEVTRRALEEIAAAKAAQPSEGPIVLSEEYLRRVERAEKLPENRRGTDKTWTERVLAEWTHLVETGRELPPG